FGNLASLYDTMYGADGVENWSTQDGFSNGYVNNIDFSTYNDQGGVLSTELYGYDGLSDGLTLQKATEYDYGGDNTLDNYYTDTFNYFNNQLYSTTESEYGSNSALFGSDQSYYNSQGYVTSDALDFYNSGSLFGSANTQYSYNGSNEV